MDRIKDVDVLLRAYDDAAGVTAAFNLNLLHRINAELDGDIPVEAFRHRAIWNDALSRIEMHLEAVRDVAFTVAGRRLLVRGPARPSTPRTATNTAIATARLLLRAAGWGVVERMDRREANGSRSCSPRPSRPASRLKHPAVILTKVRIH